MQRAAIFLLCVALAVLAPAQASAVNSKYTIATDKIVTATQFLEEHPLDPGAPVLRAAMVKWEDKAKEVVDYVCPDVLKPIPSDSIPYSAELLVQFIFGSAAHQLAYPADKGVLVPSQLAGMRSMLKAYAGFLAADPKARVPRLDELTQMEADGQLDAYLTPIVLRDCKTKS
jgi:hypothetical protein